MKHFQIALVLFPISLIQSAARATLSESTGPVPQVSEMSVVDIESAIDRKVADAATPKPTAHPLAQDFADIELLIRGLGLALEPFPGECRIQARLEAEIAELRSRATRYSVRADEVFFLQQEIVLNRMERQVIGLQESLTAGKSTREAVQKAVTLLQSQAFDFLETLDNPGVRTRLTAAVMALSADAHAQMDPYEHVRAFYVELMAARIEMALQQIQKHGGEGRLSQRDVQRLVEAYKAQNALVEAAISIPYDCGS